MKKYVIGIGIASAAVLILRCLPPASGCTPLATQCTGNVAEICDSEQRWGTYMDCTQIGQQSGGTWVCCPNVDAGASCMPNSCSAQGGSQ